MSSSRSTFLSGTIFGIVIGVILGHFSIWNRSNPTSIPVEQTFSVKELAPNGMPSELGESASNLPYYPEVPLHPVEEYPAPDLDEITAAESPLANAIAMETVLVEDVTTSAPNGTIREIAESTQEPDSTKVVPKPLDVEDAAPLEAVPSKNQDAVRKAIDEELADTPKAQRDVWYDSLKDMHVDDATGVIRMWKMIGGPIPGLGDDSLFSLPSSTPSMPPSTTTAPQETEAEASSLNAVIKEAIAIHQRNTFMESTLGYIRMVPRFIEEESDSGLVVTGVIGEFDLTAGSRFVAGAQLDFMIKGPGMFLVKNEEGRQFLTRRGRFSLNDNRELALLDPTAEYTLQPPIRIPEEAARIKVTDAGMIELLDAEGDPIETKASMKLVAIQSSGQLTYYKNGLINYSGNAEQQLVSPGNNQIGFIRQGFLEIPTVNVATELSEIERLQSLLH